MADEITLEMTMSADEVRKHRKRREREGAATEVLELEGLALLVLRADPSLGQLFEKRSNVMVSGSHDHARENGALSCGRCAGDAIMRFAAYLDHVRIAAR